MFIENLKNQDLEKLNKEVVKYFVYFWEDSHMTTYPDLQILNNFHPESGWITDVWQLINFIESISGGWKAEFDSTTYDFTMSNKNNKKTFVGYGLSLGQAVCNSFVEFSNDYIIKLREMEHD